MATRGQDRGPYRPSAFLAIAVMAAMLLAVAADHLGLFHGLDTYFYDLSFRLRGERAPGERVIIAAVDEKTLSRLGRWPLERGHYARMLDRLGKEGVVGFDLIMSEATPQDPLLATAIRRHGRVFLPIYFDINGRRIDHLPHFSPRGAGHIHLEQGIDSVVREVHHTMSQGRTPVPSLTSLMYRATGGAGTLPLPPTAGDITLEQLQRINFYGPAGTFRRISLVDILDGRYPSHLFRDRFILVGLTAAGIVDEVATPFSQDRNRMPGVELHATILQNLLDKNSIQEVPLLFRWGAALFGALLLGLAFRRLRESTAILVCLLALSLLALSCFSLFSILDLWMPPTLFATGILIAFLTSYLVRLDSAATELDSKYASLMERIGTGASPSSAPPLRRGLAGYLTEGGIDAKVQRLLMVEQCYETALEGTVSQRTRELSDALVLLDRASDEVILRLTRAVESRDEGTGEHILRVGLYAREIAISLGQPREFVELITFASAMHDIGKIGIPDRILQKQDSLTPEEMAIMRSHCLIGERILSNSSYPKLQMSSVIALNHHERWDGAGYPRGLAAEAIPLEARIFAIGDCYDALRSKRHYKPPFDHETSCNILLTKNDGHFDPRVLQAFRAVAGTFAELFDTCRGTQEGCRQQ